MRPVLFHIHLGGFDLPIYGYGLMLVIGFLAAAHLAKWLAKRSGLNGELFINAALLALVAGIVGARLSHVLENLPAYTRADRSMAANLWDAINLRSGGLTYYGGFLLAFPTLVVYAIWKKIPIRLGMDIVAPCLMIGLGFGRIGCFLNGCCYGAECELPWAIRFPYQSLPYQDQFSKGELVPNAQLLRTLDGQPILLTTAEAAALPYGAQLLAANRSRPLHPAQLYSAATAFLLAGLLLAYFTVPHVPGRVFAVMLMLEGGTRFLLELLRAEPAVWRNMSLSMILGLGLLVSGAALWVLFGRAVATSAPPFAEKFSGRHMQDL